MTAPRPTLRRGLLALLFGVCALAPARARAWDPGTTHQGLLERGATTSALHRRWMESSAMQRGLFTPLRVDPARLTEAERRLLLRATRAAPRASGAAPRGGPGACPDLPAPPGTRDECVEGDLWQATALGWLRLGIVAEVVPPERLVHHFSNLEDARATTWQDRELSRAVVRGRNTRSNGATVSSFFARSGAADGGPSAAAWLADPDDLLAPAALARHLELAHTAKTPEVRDHHFALALVCAGALVHVLQDATVPAHARADLSAFFAPLSDIPGDRGLPLQEYVRGHYGRTGLPAPIDLAPRAAGAPAEPAPPLASTFLGLLAGDGAFPGAAPFARAHFLSESRLPAPRRLPEGLTPERAAATLLRDVPLSAEDRKGARLAGWPEQRDGHLVTATGRPLAAWEVDRRGRVQLYLTRLVYRDQAAHLLPLAVDLTRSAFDLLWPDFPEHSVEGRTVRITAPKDVDEAELLAFVQDHDGTRELIERAPLEPGKTTTVELPRHPTVIVFRARRGDVPIVLERLQ